MFISKVFSGIAWDSAYKRGDWHKLSAQSMFLATVRLLLYLPGSVGWLHILLSLTQPYPYSCQPSWLRADSRVVSGGCLFIPSFMNFLECRVWGQAEPVSDLTSSWLGPEASVPAVCNTNVKFNRVSVKTPGANLCHVLGTSQAVYTCESPLYSFFPLAIFL